MRLSAKVVLLGSNYYPKSACFFEQIAFHHSFGTLCRSTSLFTLSSSLAFQLLGSRSQHAVPAVLWAPLPLPHIGHQIFVDLAFLSVMNARWKLIFDFLPRAMDTTCVHTQSWLWSSSFKQTNSPAAWFTSSCFNWYVFDVSLTRRRMPLHHQSPSKIPFWSSPWLRSMEIVSK